MPSYPRVAVGLVGAACLIPLILPAGRAQDAGGNSEEVRRRLARWQSDQTLSPFTQGIPAPTNPGPVAGPVVGPSQFGTARTKLAYSFGVNFVDPAAYGSECRLGACVNDARSMKALAEKLGFQAKIFENREATSANLFASIREAASRLQSGDVLIITYAGHGSTVRDENGDERGGKDQTWCLHDRMVIDDELAQQWTAFREGVKIYVVADSCHSGTSVRALARGLNPLTTSPGARALAGGAVAGDFRVRTILGVEQERAEMLQLAANAPTWRAAPTSAASGATIRASGLLLAGCDDEETSGERGQHGLFTNGLLQTVGDGQFTGTYRELIDRASRLVGDPNQHPKLFQFGAIVEDLATARPFAH
ncbi:MAG TPA: caspase family protein [Urbifossiella sp.]|nr:caspase family protein [Urbifossiella sp.]